MLRQHYHPYPNLQKRFVTKAVQNQRFVTKAVQNYIGR